MGAEDDYLAAAAEALDAHGPADRTLGFTVRLVSDLAEVSRSTVYRHWETVDALNGDIARFGATGPLGWQRRILGCDPATDLVEAVAQATARAAEDPGPIYRAVVSSWPEDAAARQDVVDWERRWLEAFGRWLEAHVAARGRVFGDAAGPEDVAFGVCALVEGCLELDRFRRSGRLDGWASSGARSLAIAVSEYVDELTEPSGSEPEGARDVGSIEAPPPPQVAGGSEAAAAIVEAACTEAVRRSQHTPTPRPSRLVDMARLARRLDVSERWLYSLWPTAASLNAPLVDHVVRRDHELIAMGLTATFEEALEPGAPSVASILRKYTLRHLCNAETEQPAKQAIYALAAAEPEVAERIAAAVEPFEADRKIFLATLLIAGRRPKEVLGVDDCLRMVMNVGAGFQRVVLFHPEVLDRRTMTPDGEESLVAYVQHAVFDALSLPGVAAPDAAGGV